MTTYINPLKRITQPAPVEVFKVFILRDKGLCSNSHWNYSTPDGAGMLVADPSKEYVWKPGIPTPREIVDFEPAPHKGEGICRATSGFFAYTSQELADNYAAKWGKHLTVRKCIIPAGVGYFISIEGSAIVSEELMVAE